MADAKKTAKPKAKKVAKPVSEFTGIKHKDFVITAKRSGRFLVRKDGKVVNGADKTKILVEAKLIAASLPKAKEDTAST